MADTEAKNVLGAVWASADTAEREDPEDLGMDRADGFTLPFEQIGSGRLPQRTVFNQRLREWTGWMDDNYVYGGVKPYDPDVNYHRWARCTVGRSKYVATVANGPDHGNAVSPDEEGQTVWDLY